MKVVFFSPRPFGLAFGGQEVQLLHTRDSLESLGVEVRLADYFDHDLFQGADLVHLFGSDYTHAQLGKLLAARQLPYVVSSVFYPVGRDRLAHGVLARVPFSQTWLQRRVLQQASAILPNSQAEAVLLRQLFSVSAEQIHVVPNGVDAAFVGRDPALFRARYLPAAWRDEPFVLSVGRIERRKNSLALLRAAQRLRVPIVFIGRPVPAEQDYVSTFFEMLGRSNKALHVPFLPSGSQDLANAYAAAQAHALLSDLETPGLASLEAALNGANLVVGDCPPVREYFEGYAEIVDPHREDAVAMALQHALLTPRDARRQQQYVARRFTWDEVARATLEVYRKVLDSPLG